MITRQDAKKLTDHPNEFAIMMDEHEIEMVIVAFVGVKNMRQELRSRK